MRRTKNRDDRDYDTTQLHEAGHGRSLHRDYSAHFFRWSFARRFITVDDHVLEIGCGEDKPLSKILVGGPAPGVCTYTGVDLNKLKASSAQRLTFLGEFNFVERYAELKQIRPTGFDVVLHLEVIEHMRIELGIALLKACFALLRPGGKMIMSTPCYDGVRHAANHIHEYTVTELQTLVEQVGFFVERRFGTFTDIKHIGKADTSSPELNAAIRVIKEKLSDYFDNNAISNIFGPLYPDHARNNLWICRKSL